MTELNRQQIKEMMENAENIAVVGLSPKENRPSNMVARYLIEAGYNVIPVNPGQSEILGRQCYPDLLSIPGKVDIADLFRRADTIMPVVEEAVQIKVRCVWMQQGIVNEEAAAYARENGIAVVMDRCLKVDHEALIKNQFIF